MTKLDQKTLCVITHSEKLSHEISKRKHNSLDLIQNNHRSHKKSTLPNWQILYIVQKFSSGTFFFSKTITQKSIIRKL